MSNGPISRMMSRRPRRHVRRVATLEGKLPGTRPPRGDMATQTPFVLSPKPRRVAARALTIRRTTFVVDLTAEHLDRIGETIDVVLGPPAGADADDALADDT